MHTTKRRRTRKLARRLANHEVRTIEVTSKVAMVECGAVDAPCVPIATLSTSCNLAFASTTAAAHSGTRIAASHFSAVLQQTMRAQARRVAFQNWQCTASKVLVEFVNRDYFGRELFSFPRETFLVDDELPLPA